MQSVEVCFWFDQAKFVSWRPTWLGYHYFIYVYNCLRTHPQWANLFTFSGVVNGDIKMTYSSPHNILCLFRVFKGNLYWDCKGWWHGSLRYLSHHRDLVDQNRLEWVFTTPHASLSLQFLDKYLNYFGVTTAVVTSRKHIYSSRCAVVFFFADIFRSWQRRKRRS